METNKVVVIEVVINNPMQSLTGEDVILAIDNKAFKNKLPIG